ncbi:NAD-dependent epimerase/dehydratase family protein [Vibrio splendidus]|uniref:NAD-dependent epimerase/dehydratase family protein n=1 Tax=Vibrio splendidus TaxID=29497 RepID=UPI000C85A340|nr:NAD-dependent epimerase/dehydratase family protein [Vibrio splendidus]PMO94743.1 NAD-dependent dehydratase [Vibrio splendidus]PMP20115.1 NAD-dependent dehydratase [Vibrio splendidus]PMP36872.1 NAD-dependent dehydratase [Vibrio splendidus]PMP41681.1 NAD-dependent dehydratase [Vibrio splendidus]PMP45696.1 NAD-dependent dehydratase [Vibrio splendidus]
MKILLPGGAGLLGQNLIVRLKEKGYRNIIVLDKHCTNLDILKKNHPDITAEYADLAVEGDWKKHFDGADRVVMLQAQIGAKDPTLFVRNNITSTKHVLNAIQEYGVKYTVHISSSVVESVAEDDYTKTKTVQEQIVLDSGIECVVLRPTLMFGWFDRKHLGWLSRFMQKVPVFPIPGNGKYMRQPLYVGDFANVIISCIESKRKGGVFNISGLEQVDYIDIIRSIKRAIKAKTVILKIPFKLFSVLLKVWAVFDKNPPFTADQLDALVACDEFEVIDWEGEFDVKATRFDDAVDETFCHNKYSKIELEF